MDKVILHCDLNNFYASVECLLNPDLADVPMAVGGDAKERHGLILAKNELAKSCKVLTAEPVWQARKKCPQLLVVPPHHDLYALYSRRVRAIYEEYTDQVEPFGIDECWLDVTGSQRLFGSGEAIAHKIRKKVKARWGLTISVGVSFNKVFAKLGSDMKKPDAVTVISRADYKKMVWPLPLSELLYIGRSTRERLFRLGIRTIGDLAQADRKQLQLVLGKAGIMLQDFALGRDDRPVASVHERGLPKSISHNTTLKADITAWEEVEKTFYWLADRVGSRLRKQNLCCRQIAIAIKDSKFNVTHRQKKMSLPVETSGVLAQTALELFRENYDLNRQLPVRLLGLRVSDLLSAASYYQAELFAGDLSDCKQAQLDSRVDEIREKYGFEAIQRAVFMQVPQQPAEKTEKVKPEL